MEISMVLALLFYPFFKRFIFNRQRENTSSLHKHITDLENKLNEELKLREKLISETEKQISNLKKDKVLYNIQYCTSIFIIHN